MDIRSLTIDGQRLRIGIRVGVPRLPPLIVFNGIGASLELIEPFVSALPEREVVAFDVPGSGGSPASLLPYRFPGLARLAHRLLGELGYNGAVDALGVSWGGALAQTFAFQFPTRCRKLVLASTSPGALMVPGRPSVLAKLVSRGDTSIRTFCMPSAERSMVAPFDPIRTCCAGTPKPCGRRATAATSIN